MNDSFDDYAYLDELHSELEKILVDFLNLCRSINVRVFLAYGSLLGAARHSGFIPWDDDIDVQILRDDYERLLSCFQENDDYKLVSIHNTESYSQMFAKFVKKNSNNNLKSFYTYQDGLALDIFPIDWRKGCCFFKRCRILYLEKVISSKTSLLVKKESFIKRCLRKFLCFPYRKIVPNQIAKKIDVLAKKEQCRQESLICYGAMNMREFCLCKKADFGDGTPVSFDGINCLAPLNYQKLLAIIYGRNWYKIPSNRKRKLHNGN